MGLLYEAALDREYGGDRGRPFIAFKAGGLPMPSLGRRTTGPEFRQTVQENFLTAAHSAATLSAFLLNSFASGECLAQRRLPTRAELLRGFGVRHDEIESVEGTTHDQEFGCDSGVDEPARVLHVFFDEQVESTDTDPGRRQAGDGGYPGGDGGCRHPGRACWNAEQRAPGKTIGTRIPHKVANGGRRWTCAARSVVQPGVNEQLEDDGDFVAVARVNRKARCMAAARALTAHGNSGAINAELRCMGVNPFERGVIVLKRTGIARLRSQPIVHRDDDAVAICRDPLQSGQQPGVGHHEAAAMHVKQHRLALLRRRRISDPKTNLGCTWRSGDMPLHGLRRGTRQWGHAGRLPELADYLR